MNETRLWQDLVHAACAPYRQAGQFAWRFARGKLTGDPAFRHFLASGLIPSGARVLDLGSGQGVLAALLRACHAVADTSGWPGAWAPAPRDTRVHGIELMPADVERSRAALGADAVFVGGDIRTEPYPAADVVVILDVLHYMPFDDQRRVLEKVRAALLPSGTLLLRVGDAAGGLPFRISNWVDRVVTFVRGHGIVPLHCRTLDEWTRLLESMGFRVRRTPLSQGTPFANVLLVCV